MNESHFTESDRNLIIKLSVQVERAIADIADLKGRYEKREEDFMLRKDADLIHQDQERRLRMLERWGSILVGGLYILNVAIGYYLLSIK